MVAVSSTTTYSSPSSSSSSSAAAAAFPCRYLGGSCHGINDNNAYISFPNQSQNNDDDQAMERKTKMKKKNKKNHHHHHHHFRSFDNMNDKSTDLFMSTSTWQCAMEYQCIPCAYKIGNFDIAMDHEFCHMIPNQRPEMCHRHQYCSPRSAKHKTKENQNWNKNSHKNVVFVGIKNNNNNRKKSDHHPFSVSDDVTVLLGTVGYHVTQSILVLGDGDFSFSLSLARGLLLSSSSSQSSVLLSTTTPTNTRIVATSYESIERLQQVYPGIIETIHELQQYGVIGTKGKRQMIFL
jgi:hypothetical protein